MKIKELLVESIPEHTHSHIMKKIRDGEWEAQNDVEKGKTIEIRHVSTGKRKMIRVKHDPVK